MKIVAHEDKFTLANFDKWIDAAMLQKGRQYYKDGAVSNLEENLGEWAADVEGTENYNVTVSVTDGQEINNYHCNCPYNGDLCKHLAAVFYAIRDEVKKWQHIPKKEPKKKPFDYLLSRISADEFNAFVSSYAAKNRGFKTEFEIYFADKDDRIDIGKKYTDLIRKLVKKASSGGFVDYRSSSGLANDVTHLIEKGYNFANNKNYRDAFAIATSALKEMMQVLTYSDDSSGSMGDTLNYAIELIATIAQSEYVATDMREHIFKFLQGELNDRTYFGYGDFGYDLFAIYKQLAIQLTKHQDFLNFIDAQLPKLTGEYDSYGKRFLKTERISFLQAIGRKEEADVLIQQNMEIVEVRQGEVNKAIDKKDFSEAKKLIAGGIKIAEANKHSGTIFQWEKELLRIALLEGDLILTRQFYKRFAFSSAFDRHYYMLWKNTYDKDEWTSVIDEHIDATIKKVTSGQGKNKWASLNYLLLTSLAPIYIEEKYWDRLFALVKNETSLDRILQYHSYLVPYYPSELLQLYLPALEEQGDKASDRRQYAELVDKMKKILKDIPFSKEQVITVVKNLKGKYPRRPAMIEELNKLLK